MPKSEVLLNAPHASHYKKLGIEPIEYVEQNNLGFHEGNIVKYVTRWRDKEGLKDLEKVIWYAQRLIEQEKKRLETLQVEVSPGSNPPGSTWKEL